MNRRVIFMLVVLLVMASSAMAFDGVRKGFVLGGGIGFAPVIKAEVDTPFGPYELSESGVGINILIGYSWDEFNMLVYEGNAAAASIEGITIAQGIDAITWYHYWGPMGKTLFTAVGVGLYSYQEDGSPDFTSKTGILLGAGYEFSSHWQVGLYLSSGKTELYDVEVDHTTVAVLVSGVAF